MNNKFNKIIVSFIVTVMMVACDSDSFLTEGPVDELPTETALATASLIDAAVTGGYDLVARSSYYGRDFIMACETMSDNVVLNPSNSGRFVSEYLYSSVKGDGDARGVFSRIYEVIAAGNNIINFADNCEDCTDEELNQAKGQAYALRAMGHFDLLRLFAFPYNTTATSVAPGADGTGGNLGVQLRTDTAITYPARSTVSEGFDMVISDLETAATLLQNLDGSALGTQFSKQGVEALLSRVYLYRGTNADLLLAKSYANSVISSGIYALLSNSSYAAGWSGLGNSETILQVAYSSVDNNATNALSYIYIPEGYGDFPPSTDLLGLYSSNDVRNSWFQTSDLTYTYKFPGRDGQATLSDIPLIRLSEMYLNLAEAEYKLGNEGLAQDALDLIVQRADPSLGDNSSTGADLLNDILTERRKELAFEGHRLFDVNRNQLDMVRVPGDISYPNCRTIYPIPVDETNANPNVDQNECY